MEWAGLRREALGQSAIGPRAQGVVSASNLPGRGSPTALWRTGQWSVSVVYTERTLRSLQDEAARGTQGVDIEGALGLPLGEFTGIGEAVADIGDE